MQCPYYDPLQSGEDKGWFCKEAGHYVSLERYHNYCSGRLDPRECDFRPDYKSAAEESGKSREKPDRSREKDSSSEREPESSSGSGSTRFSPRAFIAAIITAALLFAFFPKIKSLFGNISLFNSKLAVTVSSEDPAVDLSRYSIWMISTDKGLDYNVKKEEVGKDGAAILKLKEGRYYLDFVCRDRWQAYVARAEVDGSGNYDYALTPDGWTNSILYLVFQTQDGDPIPADQVQVALKNGAEPQMIDCVGNHMMIWLLEEQEELELTITSKGKQELSVLADTASRSYQKITVALLPSEERVEE